MHAFRFLEIAIETGDEKGVNVKRPNRDFLLDIKSGKYEYDELLKMAKDRQGEMERVFDNSELPEKPNINKIDELTFGIRDKFYKD